MVLASSFPLISCPALYTCEKRQGYWQLGLRITCPQRRSSLPTFPLGPRLFQFGSRTLSEVTCRDSLVVSTLQQRLFRIDATRCLTFSAGVPASPLHNPVTGYAVHGLQH